MTQDDHALLGYSSQRQEHADKLRRVPSRLDEAEANLVAYASLPYLDRGLATASLIAALSAEHGRFRARHSHTSGPALIEACTEVVERYLMHAQNAEALDYVAASERALAGQAVHETRSSRSYSRTHVPPPPRLRLQVDPGTAGAVHFLRSAVIAAGVDERHADALCVARSPLDPELDDIDADLAAALVSEASRRDPRELLEPPALHDALVALAGIAERWGRDDYARRFRLHTEQGRGPGSRVVEETGATAAVPRPLNPLLDGGATDHDLQDQLRPLWEALRLLLCSEDDEASELLSSMRLSDFIDELRPQPWWSSLATDLPEVALGGVLGEVEDMILRGRAEGRTLDHLGRGLGVTRERVRQIEARASRRLLRAFGNFQQAWPGTGPSQLIGAGAPERLVMAVLTPHIDASDDQLQRIAIHMLMRELGYQLDDHDWWWPSFTPSPLTTYGELLDSTKDEERARLELTEILGLPRWLQPVLVEEYQLPKRRLIIEEAVVEVLSFAGAPLRIEELVARAHRLVPERSVRAIRNTVTGSHQVMAVGNKRYGLVAWGLDEYAGIADAMVELLEEMPGRSMPIHDVVAHLAEFDVPARSVRGYASGAPCFALHGGVVALRSLDDYYAAVPPPSSGRGSYRIGGSWAQLFTYEQRYDKGFSVHVGRAWVKHIGGHLDETLRIPVRGHDARATVSWPSRSNGPPFVGSLRPVFTAMGLTEGERGSLRVEDGELVVARCPDPSA